MASQDELEAFLSEHLAYEREMLRFTHDRLLQERDQMLFNVFIESFGIHARNLYQFLRGEKDNRNMTASHYVKGYRAKPEALFNRFDESLFHLSKGRLDFKKAHIEHVTGAMQWIDKNWADWVARLPEPMRAKVDATPIGLGGVKGPPLSATNYVFSITGPARPPISEG